LPHALLLPLRPVREFRPPLPALPTLSGVQADVLARLRPPRALVPVPARSQPVQASQRRPVLPPAAHRHQAAASERP